MRKEREEGIVLMSCLGMLMRMFDIRMSKCLRAMCRLCAKWKELDYETDKKFVDDKYFFNEENVV